MIVIEAEKSHAYARVLKPTRSLEVTPNVCVYESPAAAHMRCGKMYAGERNVNRHVDVAAPARRTLRFAALCL